MYAQVIVDIANANVDKLFTYSVPEDMQLVQGQRVLVPFGAGNKRIEGFVLGLIENAPNNDYHIKPVLRTLEPYSVLMPDQIELANWIKESYHCLLVDALRLMIPAQLRGGRIKEKLTRTVCIADGLDIVAAQSTLLKKDGTPKAPVQYEVLRLIGESKMPISINDINAFIPGASTAIRALLTKGLIQEQGHTTFRDPLAGIKMHSTQPLQLNAAQQHAYETIVTAMRKGEGTLLLHGVTGSGKTEVYMQAIANAINEGGTAMVLVPEIALTPQTMEHFRSRFGDSVALLHSRLSAGERYDEWRRIRLNRIKVVVGARSAVFAPLINIKLIIIDEEHEPSYQSEITPRYNTIETAAKRCRLSGAALVLGSATPSITSYLRAKNGQYVYIELPERVNDLPMPSVEIVDMRQEFMSGNTTIFSSALYERLKVCIAAGEQAILFINRRGYSTFVSCRGCGYVIKCADCDVSMTYHKLDDRLKCHYCGRYMRVPDVCPECGKPYLKYFGIGTQQVQEQLEHVFPGTTSLRMDMDTTRTKNSHYNLLSSFSKGDAQVLIGTQMVAKGLDIPSVTLVGIIAADATLHIPDYRNSERTFQLITQVAGRAGRAEWPGYVVIQTYSPEHPAITLAAKHDYKGFYEHEIIARRMAMFPPFSLFVRAMFVGEDEAQISDEAHSFMCGLKACIEEALIAAGGDIRELLMLVDMPSPVKRKQKLFRYQVLLKLARTKHTSGIIRRTYAFSDTYRTEHFAGLEINPASMF
ncbi:MAG: primosomal protein N' [Clostridia bacterium]